MFTMIKKLLGYPTDTKPAEVAPAVTNNAETTFNYEDVKPKAVELIPAAIQQPVEAKPVEAKPVEAKPVEAKPVAKKKAPAVKKPAGAKRGGRKPKSQAQ